MPIFRWVQLVNLFVMSGILSFVLTVINIGFDGRLLFIWPRNWAIAFVIAVREAAEFDTGKAVITAVITFIAIFLVSMLIGTILGVGGATVGALTAPAR